VSADDGFCLTSPEARTRAPRPARVTGRDPYRVPGPAVVSVSGGRTSGMMLRGVLDAYGGTLPADVHAVFANTGEEHPDTLDFVREMSTRWGVEILWLEYDPTAPESYARVDYDTAARDGEPFAALVRAKRYLPNAVTRFCTQELKLAPMRRWMQARYGDDWTNVVGLRFDEPDRVSKLRARDAAWDVACPLYDAGATKAAVTSAPMLRTTGPLISYLHLEHNGAPATGGGFTRAPAPARGRRIRCERIPTRIKGLRGRPHRLEPGTCEPLS